MAMPVLGSILRRSGIIFIRRNIGDDPLYKYVLKEYVGYVAEKRFNLMWAIEGTRSRTGKMLPPKLGLLSYVADAYLDGRSDDIRLQPVSISFDQLGEIAEYAEYARGAEKKPENLGWAYKFIKSQGDRNYGKIYVRFPESVSMRQYLGSPHGPMATDAAAKRLALQKMAIEVAWRIQQSTPINANALVAALLLATRGVALTLGQIHHTLQDALDYLERRKTPMTDSAQRLRSAEGVRATLDALSGGDPVTRVDGGWEPVWRIAPEHEHEAAFYRNSVVHAFLETCIVELALAHAAHADGDRVDAFWAQAMRLRDLLKFDFYFADSTAFREHIASEMAWQPGLGNAGCAVPATSMSCCLAKRPLLSYVMLRPFFEAYEILADVLSRAAAQIGEKELAALAMGVGRQYLAQGRVRSSESVSTLLFATASKVATDKHLLEPGSDLDRRRKAFHRELLSILDDIDDVESIANEQFKAREPTSRNTFRRPSPPSVSGARHPQPGRSGTVLAVDHSEERGDGLRHQVRTDAGHHVEHVVGVGQFGMQHRRAPTPRSAAQNVRDCPAGTTVSFCPCSTKNGGASAVTWCTGEAFSKSSRFCASGACSTLLSRNGIICGCIRRESVRSNTPYMGAAACTVVSTPSKPGCRSGSFGVSAANAAR